MDYSKINFKSYIPSYDKYFEQMKDDNTMKEFVYFTPSDSNLIFYDDTFIGFYKALYDEDENSVELFIGIAKEFRGKGIGSYVINKLSDSTFQNNANCESIDLSIDKDNISSIAMALKSNYQRNLSKEEELRKFNDDRTMVFTRYNPNRDISIDSSLKM